MDVRLMLPRVLIVFLTAHCTIADGQTTQDRLRVKLTDQWIELIGEDTMAAFTAIDSSTMNADAFLIFAVPVVPPAGRSPREYTPTVVNAHITKRGNVKRAWIVSSGSPYFNQAVLKAVVKRKYHPRITNGIPVDTLITISVPLR